MSAPLDGLKSLYSPAHLIVQRIISDEQAGRITQEMHLLHLQIQISLQYHQACRAMSLSSGVRRETKAPMRRAVPVQDASEADRFPEA